MKIAKINLYQFNRTFKIGFHSSHTLRTGSESIIVRLELENGISGYGESTPRAYVTGENCSKVVKLIQKRYSPTLFSHRINTINDVEEILNELERECLKRNIFEYNSALGAIDIALLDALSRLQNLSITRPD